MSHSKLSQDLQDLLLHGDEDGIKLSELVVALGDRGFGLLFIILSLPSALPIPAPGYSTPFGIMITILAIQMMIGRKAPWLPRWATKRRIGRKMAEKMIGTASKFFGKVEHLIKPRWGWVLAKSGHLIAGILIIVMACLMILPIPLTNTAPAMVIFIIGVAMTEDDGLGMLAACGLAVCAVLLYIGVFWAISYYGLQGVDELKEIVKGWLSSGE
jgi:hypothetical protein